MFVFLFFATGPVVPDQEVFSDKLKLVEVFKEDPVDVNDKPSMLDTEDELKEEARVLDERLEEEEGEEGLIEGNSKISIFTRAASILSHFLLLHRILSFLEESLHFK